MQCLQSARYKFCNLTSFAEFNSAILPQRKIKNINNISLNFIMLTDNNQILRNCFVIIYCDLTKVASEINNCIIFQPNELSITLWVHWGVQVSSTALQRLHQLVLRLIEKDISCVSTAKSASLSLMARESLGLYQWKELFWFMNAYIHWYI